MLEVVAVLVFFFLLHLCSFSLRRGKEKKLLGFYKTCHPFCAKHKVLICL